MDSLSGQGAGALAVGETAERSFTVTEADIAAFAAVSGDYNPLHLDEAYAATTQFKGRIAHGMLTAGYISTVLGGMIGAGGIYLSQTLNFKRPVRLGATVVVKATVTEIEPRTRKVTGAIVCKVDGKTVVDGVGTLLAPYARLGLPDPGAA